MPLALGTVVIVIRMIHGRQSAPGAVQVLGPTTARSYREKRDREMNGKKDRQREDKVKCKRDRERGTTML